jgi:AcrR family transcriptional regulator
MRKRSVVTPKPADSYHHGDLRQALIDAAFAQVESAGADSLSLAQLAKALRVSQPAPYKHFPDRDALLAIVAARGFREFTAQLQKAVDANGKGSALLRMSRAYVEFGTRRPGIYRLMFASHILAERSVDQELGLVARGSFNLLVDAIDGKGGPRRRQLKALRIWVALHGLVMLTIQGLMKGGDATIETDDLIEEILAD